MLSSSTHNHTTWCDGKNTPEEMAQAAWEQGFTDLGFSGHTYVDFADFGIRDELAYAAMLFYKVVYYACGGAAPQLVLDFLYVLISMNISLGVFNLIPVPPFDGSRIVLLFLPQKLYFQAMRYEKYIMGVVLLLVFFGLLNTPLNLCVNAAWRLLLNLTGFVELLFGIA